MVIAPSYVLGSRCFGPVYGTNDCFRIGSLAVMGRFDPDRVEESGRSGYEGQHQDIDQLFYDLPTLIAAPAADLNVDLLALTDRIPDGVDRLQPLQIGLLVFSGCFRAVLSFASSW